MSVLRASECARKTFEAVYRWLHPLVARLPGQYTVSKLDAFHRFQQRTSPWQVAAILLLTPMPSLVVNLLVEAIPLADPATGYRNSIGFQTRYFLVTAVQHILPAIVKKEYVPDFPMGSWKLVGAFGAVQATIGTVTNAVISLATGIFPVPFTHFTPTIPMTVSGVFICRRRRAWGPKLPDFRANNRRIDKRVGMELLPIFVYPVFTALFMYLPPLQQLYLSLLLPVIKVALRRWLWLVSRSDEDLVGVVTCCVGHWYHILFTSVIFQTAKSFEALASVGLFNGVQMYLNAHKTVQDANALTKARRQLEIEHPEITMGDNVAIALRLADEEEVASKLHAKIPSALLSTYSGYHDADFISKHSTLFRGSSSLSTLEKRSPSARINKQDSVARKGKTKSHFGVIRTTSKFVQVLPSDGSHVSNSHAAKPTIPSAIQVTPLVLQPIDLSESTLASSSLTEPCTSICREDFIQKLAAALHQTEMILLRSYITIFTTCFYAVYLAYIVALPNHIYFATLTTDVDITTTTMRLVLLCGLEILFSGIYLTLIHRRLGVSAIYQLAFVLSSQWILVQAKFVMLSLVILGFPLQHYGNGIIYHLAKDNW